jgi:hypothetical protein
MKRIAIAAIVWLALGLAFGPAGAATANAAEGEKPAPGADPNFKQRKARLLEMFDARIASIEEAKSCVEKATNRDGVKACMEKHNAEMRKRREGGRNPGGPGGAPGRPPGP